jgi:peptidoglycan-associated lipoprotein
MRQGRARVFLVAPLLLMTLFLVGCPKRPATTAASAVAPAPSAPVVVAPPAPATGGTGAAPTPGPSAAAPSGPATAPGTPPSPSEFSANPALKDIYFDFDKYDIRAADAKTLDENATWLKRNDTLVLIEGHCDERGTNEYNLALGERRAKATMNYLVSQGIQANRITIISYGEERPVCTEKNESCYQKNRHAHFLVKAR